MRTSKIGRRNEYAAIVSEADYQAVLSVSGSLMILGLLFLKSLLRNKISRQWQYYVWLIAIARLLLPITPDTSLTI